MNPILKAMRKILCVVEAEQVCVDYNGTVALYDASLNLKAGSIWSCGYEWCRKINFFQGPNGFC